MSAQGVVVNGTNTVCVFITKTRPCNIQRFFHGCKNDNFQLIYFDFFHIFHIFTQNIYCLYTLEPPHCKPQFYYIKVGCEGV